MKTTNFLLILALLIMPLQELIAQNCSHGATTSQRDNKLYLYFPTADDNSFQSPIFGVVSNPLPAFDVADLDAGIGTTAQLRDAVFNIVVEDYCEFNVEVIQTTTSPNTTGVSRWNIMGMGSDTNGGLFGIAQAVDIGDNDPQDFARVWAGSFGNEFTGPGEALAGANSTLNRWARAIGHTTSHEAGHNYGAGHGDSSPRTGTVEDIRTNHVMATGSSGLNGEIRTTVNRHFSDDSYEILAHNVGLNIMSVYNWDFINPNDVDAHSMEITLLSEASSLSLSTWWNGNRSPWQDPTITDTSGTRDFQGTTYNEFTLTFTTPKSWIGGADGVAPAGAEFHTGAGFAESDLVIVFDIKLQGSGGSDLDLHPRMADFDMGAADLSSGDFAMTMFNPNPEDGNLFIQDMNIQYLPRLLDIDAMLTDVPMVDVRGNPVIPHGACNPRSYFELDENKTFRLGKLSDSRTVDRIYSSKNCNPGVVTNGPDDRNGREMIYCPDGNALSLFPSTTVYVSATIVEPNARYFDPVINDFVNGPLESKVFYQFAGILPDFNDNGIDDIIDIRSGTSVDENNNGVPDEVDPSQIDEDQVDPIDDNKLPWWIYLIFIILIIIILILYFGRDKRKQG